MNDLHIENFLPKPLAKFHDPHSWVEFLRNIIIINDKYDENDRYDMNYFLEMFKSGNVEISKMYLKLFSLNDEMFNKRLQSFAENNAENINKIILIIRSDREKLFPINIDDIDIYCDKFKKICNTIIYLPNIFPYFLSGIFIIYLAYNGFDSRYLPKINFVWKKGLLKGVSEEDLKISPKDYAKLETEYKRKIFYYNSPSYLNKLEKKLKINLNGISKSPKNVLWKLLELYGYYTHDFVLNNDKSQDSSFFDLWTILMSKGSLDKIPHEYKENFFFLSVILLKLRKDDIDNILDTLENISEIFINIMIISPSLMNYIQTLMIAKQTAGYEYAIEYHELFTELEQWLEDKLNTENASLIDSKDKFSSFPKIKVKENDLYSTVYYRTVILEYCNIIDAMEESLIFHPQVLDDKKLQFYLASHPNEIINVDNWDEFKQKFSYQLKILFESIKEDEQKEAWVYSIVALLCAFSDIYKFPIDEVKATERISENWLKKYAEYTRNIKIEHVFVLMHIYLYAPNILVETKGKNTAFFQRILDTSTTKKSRQKNLQELIKDIKTHYTSKAKPDNYNLLTFQIIRLIVEQRSAFFMTEKMYMLSSGLEKLILKKFKQDVLYTISIHASRVILKDYKRKSQHFLKWITNLRNDIIKMKDEAKDKCFHYKEFLEKIK